MGSVEWECMNVYAKCAVRQLIGTAVIEEDFFGLLNDGDFEGLLGDYMSE